MDLTAQSLLGLAFAPGIVLLVLSSAFRYQTLENQVIRLTTQGIRPTKVTLKVLADRACRFRAAFLALYAALALLSTAAIAAVVAAVLGFDQLLPAVPLVLVSLLLVLFAIMQLVLEARHGVTTLIDQIDDLGDGGTESAPY